MSYFASSRRACLSVRSKPASRPTAFRARVDGFFGKRPMITQVHQRREQIVAQHAARLRDRCAAATTCAFGRSIFQLEDDAFGRLLADAGNRREPREITAFDRADELARLDARQHGEADLRPDAADANQPLEQIEFERASQSRTARSRLRARACARAARRRPPTSPRP